MRPVARLLILLLVLAVPGADVGAGWIRPVDAAPRRAEVVWTLLLQLPRDGVVRVERAGGTLKGRPETLVSRLGKTGVRTVRRIATGTVSVESRRVRDLRRAGNMLVVAVGVPAGRRVRAISTNRLPLSEDPGHLTLLNLQLVAEGELIARSPFSVLDERGRTAVLFQ